MLIQSILAGSPAARGSFRWHAALVTAALAAALSGHARADDYLEAIGGPGGGQFEARCSAGEVLVGFELRVGAYVDAIRPLCASAYGSREVGPASASQWHGGAGGGFARIACPSEQPIATGLFVGTEVADTKIVNNLLMYCGRSPDTRVSAPARPDIGHAGHDDTQGCRADQVAVGVHGRSGMLLDAIGLICATPRTTVKSIGRVGTPVPHKTTVTSIGRVSAASAPGAAQHICDRLQDARLRNSPAVPNLEAQCLAAGGPPAAAAASPLPDVTALPTQASAASADNERLSRRASRDAAIQSLIGSVASGISASRRDTAGSIDAHGAAATAANERVHAERSERRREPYPRSSERVSQVDRGNTAHDLSQPENSIRIEVRYPIAYGYQEANSQGAFGDLGPGSCNAFAFDYLVAPQDPEVHGLIGLESGNRMRNSNGLYVCEYTITNLPLDEPITVRVGMSGQRTSASDVWLGGSQPRPGRQQRRAIVDGERHVVLTAHQPRARLRFEMIYDGSP